MSTVGAGASGGLGTIGVPVRVEEEGFGTLLWPLLIGQAIVTADFTCMNSMIGDIAHDVKSSLTGLQTTMALSFLVMGALIIPASRIGARRGHARALGLGAGILALGDLVTAVSPTLPVLLIGKALIAAMGSALIVPAVFSLATLHYQGATRKKALGLINMQLGVGTIAGAFIGGWMATNFSWRWWFVVEVAISGVLFLLIRRHFEEGMHAKVSEFDIPGTVLSFVGLALIVLGFIQASAFGFVKARQDFHLFGVKLLSKGGLSPMLPMIALGLLFLVAFALVERRRIAAGKQPLVHLAVLGDTAVRAGGLALALNFAIMGAALYVPPVFGRTTLGWNATKAGACVGAAAAMVVVTCFVAARALAAGIAAKLLALIGFVLIFASSVALALAFKPSTGFALITVLVCVTSAGIGLGMVALSVIVQGAAPADRTSDVSGITREGGYVGQSLGVAIAGAVMIAVLVASLNSKVNASAALSAPQKQAIVTKLDKDVEVSIVTDAQVKKIAEENGATSQATVGEVVKINGQSRDSAFAWAMIFVALCALVAFVFTLRIPAPATGSEP